MATYPGSGEEVYEGRSETRIQTGEERINREFTTDDGQVDILICTESASEGLNLRHWREFTSERPVRTLTE